MDSLTQIVLGASVGEAVLGKKIGNRAALYGAIAGTIPDLDVLAGYFLDPISAIEVHRGFTHSILFCVIFAPIFGYLLSLMEKKADWKELSWLMFWGLFTHPILDAFTTWGTQLFWPLDIHLAFKSVFVIDPLYTLPFLFCLLMAMRLKRTHLLRPKWNYWGIGISSAYLLVGLMLKWVSYKKFKDALEEQQLSYIEIQNRPAPLTSLLWSANIRTNEGYYLADYSFFDSQPISFRFFPTQENLIYPFGNQMDIERLKKISDGWYVLSTNDKGEIFFNDLRFGVISLEPEEKQFVFSYKLSVKDNSFLVEEHRKTPKDGKKLVKQLWERIKGN